MSITLRYFHYFIRRFCYINFAIGLVAYRFVTRHSTLSVESDTLVVLQLSSFMFYTYSSINIDDGYIYIYIYIYIYRVTL